MANWIFDLECPRCGKTSQSTTINNKVPPVVNCGDCLMNDVEVVEFKIVKATVDVYQSPAKGLR